MTVPDMWRVACDYAVYCGEYGRSLQEIVLRQVHLDSDAIALQVFQKAHAVGLPAVARDICAVLGFSGSIRRPLFLICCVSFSFRILQIRGMTHVSRGQLSAAASWFIRGNDVRRLNGIADQLLDSYIYKGEFANIDSIAGLLENSPTVAGRLLYATKHREFHKLRQEGDDAAAARLLGQLLAGGAAPKRYWAALLWDAVPLLEAPTLVLGVEDTQALMSAMEELAGPYARAKGYVPCGVCLTLVFPS